MDRKVLLDDEKELRQKIYELTWAGKLWGRGGAIRLSRKRYKILEKLGREADALSAFSSTCYTASGQALARGEGLAVLWWLPVALWYLLRANFLSERLERIKGFSGMSADELDVRARITFKAHRYRKALQCTREALSRPNLSPDTQVLLLMGLTEIVERTYNDAIRLRGSVKPTTDVRLLKSYGEYLLRWGYPDQAEGILAQALEIARNHKLGDQELKIKAILARLKLA